MDRKTPTPAHAPHAPLTEYYDSEAQRAPFLRQIFDSTAPDYDRIERAMAFGSGPWYRRQALLRAGLAPGMRVLDVGTGTGLVAREAVAIVGDPTLVTGVDPSPGMLGAAHLPAGVELKVGGAESIPAATASADFVSMGFALRHVPDLTPAFAEFFRVLRLIVDTRHEHIFERNSSPGHFKVIIRRPQDFLNSDTFVDRNNLRAQGIIRRV